jgi:hypothetical protein
VIAINQIRKLFMKLESIEQDETGEFVFSGVPKACITSL